MLVIMGLSIKQEVMFVIVGLLVKQEVMFCKFLETKKKLFYFFDPNLIDFRLI